MVYAGTDTPGEVVSVDGGRSFGPIAEMKVADADGVERTATPADVTHVRWVINLAMPTGAGRQLSFRAVMRDVNHLPSRDVQLSMRSARLTLAGADPRPPAVGLHFHLSHRRFLHHLALVHIAVGAEDSFSC